MAVSVLLLKMILRLIQSGGISSMVRFIRRRTRRKWRLIALMLFVKFLRKRVLILMRRSLFLIVILIKSRRSSIFRRRRKLLLKLRAVQPAVMFRFLFVVGSVQFTRAVTILNFRRVEISSGPAPGPNKNCQKFGASSKSGAPS